MIKSFKPEVWLVAAIVVLTLYRLIVAWQLRLGLYVDEAQYWSWAQHLDWGYYSKPPMVAWAIWLSTALFGDSELGVRAWALLLHPLTALLLFLATRRLVDSYIALVAALLYLTMPAVSLYSLVATTDTLLLFFWSGALWAFVASLQERKVVWWVVVGIFGGLGLLSKPTMILFALVALLFLGFSATYRGLLLTRGPWIAVGVALLGYLPNLWWNINHDFVTYRHVGEISQLDQELFHLGKAAEFLAAQFVVFGPLSFALLLYLTFKQELWHEELPWRLLLVATWSFLGVIFAQALLSRAFANWALPSYVAASILLAGWLMRTGLRRLLVATMALNLVMMVVVYHHQTILELAGIKMSAKIDPAKRNKGWDQLAHQVMRELTKRPGWVVASDDRTVIAQLSYYARPIEPYAWNPGHLVRNHYELTTDLNRHIGGNLLLITKSATSADLATYAERVEELDDLVVMIYPDYGLHYKIFVLYGFKGY
ncbi:MAG: glycosyltransferase family 39 protein [Campylobacterales bacterium]